MKSNIVIVVEGPDSTEITFTQSQPTFKAPLPAGMVLGKFTVFPAGWTGTVSLSSNLVHLDAELNMITTAAINAGTLAITVTANP